MSVGASSPAVLLTDAGYKHTLAAARSLHRAGYAVDAIGKRGSLCTSSRSVRRLITNLNLDDSAGPASLITELQREAYAALLPIGARSIRFIARHREAISAHCPVVVHDARSIELCMDKARLNAHAEAIGLNVPRFWPIDNDGDAERIADEARFPVVIKKRHELDRGPVMLARDAGSLHETVRRWKRVAGDTAPLAQEFVDGEGCAFFALYDQGRLRRMVMHKRLREFPAAGGASCCAVSIHERDLLGAGKRLLDALSWHGIAMVEFKRERQTGRLQLMEVNPKFWGSLDLAIAAGVNFPLDTVRLAMGAALGPQSDYAVGVRFHWPLGRGEWMHAVTRPRSVFPVLRDCLDPRVRTNLRWSDPLPAWRAFREDLGLLRRQYRRRRSKAVAP